MRTRTDRNKSRPGGHTRQRRMGGSGGLAEQWQVDADVAFDYEQAHGYDPSVIHTRDLIGAYEPWFRVVQPDWTLEEVGYNGPHDLSDEVEDWYGEEAPLRATLRPHVGVFDDLAEYVAPVWGFSSAAAFEEAHVDPDAFEEQTATEAEQEDYVAAKRKARAKARYQEKKAEREQLREIERRERELERQAITDAMADEAEVSSVKEPEPPTPLEGDYELAMARIWGGAA